MQHPMARKRWACGKCFLVDDKPSAVKRLRKHFSDTHGDARLGEPGIARFPSVGPVHPGVEAEKRTPSADVAGHELAERGPRPSSEATPLTCGGATTCTPSPSTISPAATRMSAGTRTGATTGSRPRVAAPKKSTPRAPTSLRAFLATAVTKAATTAVAQTSSATITTAAPRRHAPSPPTSTQGAAPTTRAATPRGTPPPRRSAGEDAPATRKSGGAVSMRRSGGGSSTSTPSPNTTKRKSPVLRMTRSRARAASEPPQPAPPPRTTARRVTPRTTFAEVTRGATLAPAAVAAPARRTVRASSLPPAPQRLTRASARILETRGARAGACTPLTATTTTTAVCSSAATLATTTVTTTLCGSPIMTPAITPPLQGATEFLWGSPSGTSILPPPPPSSTNTTNTILGGVGSPGRAAVSEVLAGAAFPPLPLTTERGTARRGSPGAKSLSPGPLAQQGPRAAVPMEGATTRTAAGMMTSPPAACPLPTILESSLESMEEFPTPAAGGKKRRRRPGRWASSSSSGSDSDGDQRSGERREGHRRGARRRRVRTDTSWEEICSPEQRQRPGQPPREEKEEVPLPQDTAGEGVAPADRSVGSTSVVGPNNRFYLLTDRASSPVRFDNVSDAPGSNRGNIICFRCGAEDAAPANLQSRSTSRPVGRAGDASAGAFREQRVDRGPVGSRDSARSGRPPSRPPRGTRPTSCRDPRERSGSARDAPSTALTPGNTVPARRNLRAEIASERSRLVALAEDVRTPEQLEELSRQLDGFLQLRCRREQGARADTAASGGRAGRPRQAEDANQRSDVPLSHSEQVAAATRLQRLFRQNRKRAVREVLSGGSPPCDVPLDLIEEHFTNIFAFRSCREPLPALQYDIVEPGSNDLLTAPFAPEEVARRLRRMKVSSSPGPDGISYGDLREIDPEAVVLTATFNSCCRLERVPSGWGDSLTVLLYKKGDKADLSNWRPIALGNVVPKLFAAVWADRLTRWVVKNRRLCQAQKGFLPHEGCLEHNFVLQQALADARRGKREIVVAWLDLTNAFGSVPHPAILGALSNAGAPQGVVKIVESLYTGSSTRVRARGGLTEKITMRSGVRQGCPLSPILFDLAIEPMVRAAVDSGAGYGLGDHRVAALAYADDIALIASSRSEMDRLLAATGGMARSLGLSFNPRKCATLHLSGAGRVLPTEFSLEEGLVPALGEGEAYEHLGVPTGVSVDQTPYHSIRDMFVDIDKVDRSLLAPWQKIETVATFIVPRIDFLLRGADVAKGILNSTDAFLKRTVKRWLNLPQRASPELVFMPSSRGGCGIPPLADLADIATVSHAFKLLNASDSVVADTAKDLLLETVRRRLRRPPTNEELAGYLSGSSEGSLARLANAPATFWSRVRSAARRSGAKLGFEWVWGGERGELAMKCRSSDGRHVVVTPAACNQIYRRLRAAVGESYLAGLTSKPDQGKVYECTSRNAVSNHFMRTGGFTRFADWRFVHRARLDVLPLNGARRWGEGDKRCRRCGFENETLPHVLNHCGVHSAARQRRHHNIVQRLAKASRLPGELKVDRRLQGVPDDFAALRPDIVVSHRLSKSVVIVDVTVPFENTTEAFRAAREEKLRKYAPLAEALRRDGYVVHVDAFVVGSLGGWDAENEAVLHLLRVSRSYARLMRRLMVSETIAWSRDVYVEHVSGIRQYSIPRPADEDAPGEVPPAPRPDDATATGCRDIA